MPKILHLIKSLGRGGAEMLLPETLRVHDRNRFEMAYAYFVPEKDQMARALREQGVEVRCFSARHPGKLLLQSPEIARYARNWGADLIHCHLPLAGVAGRIAGKIAGVPVMYTEHNKQERYHPLTRRLNLATMGWNERVLAVSDNVQESLLNHWPRHNHKIKLLLNGVNTQRFNPKDYPQAEARERLGIPIGVPIVGTVCVFRVQKRLHLWLQLAKQMHDVYPQVHFVIVGDGPEEARLKQLAHDYGLSAHTHFPGRLEEVRPWFAAMDLYLMTSEFEGLPIAMLEAMSMTLPVVSTTAGGIGEVVRPGKEGHLASVEDSPALLPHLLQLLENPARRQAMGQAARQRVIEAFSIERMAQDLEQIYEEVLAKGVKDKEKS